MVFGGLRENVFALNLLALNLGCWKLEIAQEYSDLTVGSKTSPSFDLPSLRISDSPTTADSVYTGRSPSMS